jgi:HPt (histidine-containing phosphotransfer) domain-containing protein
MNDYMSKPVRKDTISEILEKWILQKETKEAPMNTPIDQPDQPILFDEAELLDNFGGERDFAESILEDSLQELPGEINTLTELAKGEDAEAIRHQAHTLKGIAATMCAPVLREICFKIETAAHEENIESVRQMLPELEQTVLKTEAAIRNRV